MKCRKCDRKTTKHCKMYDFRLDWHFIEFPFFSGSIPVRGRQERRDSWSKPRRKNDMAELRQCPAIAIGGLILCIFYPNNFNLSLADLSEACLPFAAYGGWTTLALHFSEASRGRDKRFQFEYCQSASRKAVDAVLLRLLRATLNIIYSKFKVPSHTWQVDASSELALVVRLSQTLRLVLLSFLFWKQNILKLYCSC